MTKPVTFVALLFALLLCGCSASPEQVFVKLKTAALEGDSGFIWDNVTRETRLMFADGTGVDLSTASEAQVETAGYDHLKTLVTLLTPGEKERIRLIKFGKVNESDTVAIMSLVLGREGTIDQTLTFRKVDGKWLWDARDLVQWYIQRRSDFTALGDL